MSRLFGPKQILDALKDVPAATYRTLHGRVEKGYIKQTQHAYKRGSKSLYALEDALIYALSLHLETLDLDMEVAANLAQKFIREEFWHRNSQWNIILYGVKISYLSFFATAYPSKDAIMEQTARLEKAYGCKIPPVIITNPLPGIYFKFFHPDFHEYITRLGKFKGMTYTPMHEILQDLLIRFSVTKDELEDLAKKSQKNCENQLLK